MIGYSGGRFGDSIVREGVHFDSKSLILAVPVNSGSAAQLTVLAEMKNYAMNNGVFLDIRGVP